MTNIKEQVELIIYNKILEIIKSELTIGRNDRELNMYNNTEINNFIENNKLKILKLKNLIIEEYEKDNELELLLNPENDWITEYMDDLTFGSRFNKEVINLPPNITHLTFGDKFN